jgi:hypothetical protein
MADPQFPWEMFMQAQQAKTQNQQQLMQAIGQALASTGQAVGQRLQKKRQLGYEQELGQALTTANNPVQGPSTAPAEGPMTQTGQPPVGGNIPPVQPPVDVGKLQNLFSKVYPGQESPFMKQMAERVLPNPTSRSGMGQVTVYQDPQSGEVSRIQKPGYLPTQVSGGEALQMTGIPRATSEKQKFSEKQQGVKNLNKDWTEVRKIINPFRSSGIGGASSVFNKAAAANQAAARGLVLARKKDLTFKELNAYVNSDVASIQRGGGVTTDIQLQESNYSTLKSKLADIQTFMTSMPATSPDTKVPDELKKRMQGIITDIIDVDNQIIDDGISYAKSSYPEAINAHLGTWNNMVKEAEKIKTVGSVSKYVGKESNDNSDISKMSDEELRKIAGGQ